MLVGGGGEEKLMLDINIMLLVDVMLVFFIIFLIVVFVVIQMIEKLWFLIIVLQELKDKVENFLFIVSMIDVGGCSVGDFGFEGVLCNGDCWIYFNNIMLVILDELCEQVFKCFDVIVKCEGGLEVLKVNLDCILQVYICGDVEVFWCCVVGVIYSVQVFGYLIVGFILNLVDFKG